MVIVFTYRPPNTKTVRDFSEKMLNSLNKVINDYENIVLVSGLSINVLYVEKDISNYLKHFTDFFL